MQIFSTHAKDIFKPYLFTKKIINVVVALLLVFSFITGFTYFSMERQIYLENLSTSTAIMNHQIASLYEVCIQNIKEIANKSAQYDKTLLTTPQASRQTTVQKTNILNFLTGLSVMNDYIHSSYLYFTEDNMVFSSLSLPSTLSYLEFFGDKEVLENFTNQTSTLLSPRLLDSYTRAATLKSKPLVITLITAVPLNSGVNATAYLLINIDAKKLYETVFKTVELSDNFNFHIVNQEGTVIFHKDPYALFTKEADLEISNKNLIATRVTSSNLGWSFVLTQSIPPLKSDFLRFLMIIVGVLILILIVATSLIAKYLAPLKKMVYDAKDIRLKDFLTSNAQAVSQSAGPLIPENTLIHANAYAMLTLTGYLPEVSENMLKQVIVFFKTVSESYRFHVVQLSNKEIGIILGIETTASETEILNDLQHFCTQLLTTLKESHVAFYMPLECRISRIKNNINLMHEAYKETCEISRLSYSLTAPIKCYTDIADRIQAYLYPETYARQLINNLVVGNEETCWIYVEKILASFFPEEGYVTDEAIRKNIYLLQNNILAHLLALPIPIKVEPSKDLDNTVTFEVLKENFLNLITTILDKVNSKDKDDRSVLHQAVIRFIDENFCDNAICLKMVAENIGLNSNYISKIIKELTGKTFSEYVNYKRIKRSKELIRSKAYTINEISDTVGFSYTYYFIRKFKEIEGITPGQYSESLD